MSQCYYYRGLCIFTPQQKVIKQHHVPVIWGNYRLLADTPLEYPRSFVLGGKKNLQGGKGKGIRGVKEEKTEGEKRKKCKKASISLKSPMPYLSPTVTLKLHCEQFWTFIVIVTFDLLRTLLRMRAYEQTDKDNYI